MELECILPPHLVTDARYKQCSECGRKSWDEPDLQELCWMPQPNNSHCPGMLEPAFRLVQLWVHHDDIEAVTALAARLKNYRASFQERDADSADVSQD